MLCDARSGLVGPIDELEKVTGKALKKGYSFAAGQTVEEKARVGGYVVQLETQRSGEGEAQREKAHASTRGGGGAPAREKRWGGVGIRSETCCRAWC